MSLTEFALERRTVTGTLIAVLIFAGVGAYVNAPRQMDPGFIIRTAMITTNFPGASPARVEQLITDPIEKAVQEIPELDFVNSESRTGVSVIYVNIREEFKEMRPIWDDLRRKVDAVAPNLPEGVIGPNVNDEFGDVYPIMFSMTGDGFSYMQLKDIADDLRDELLRVESVAKVDILGAQEERLFVEYNNAVLSKLGMTPKFLKDNLQQRNIIQPGGEIDVERESIALEPSGNFSSVDELKRTVIRLPTNDELVYLEDIVDIYRDYVDPPEGLVRIDGHPGLTLAISMAEGGNLIQLGERLDGFFQFIQEQYPHGVDFHKTYFQPTIVEKKVGDFVDSVVQAVVIVLVIMLLTLGLRTGFVVATLVPATMIIAMWVMSLFGIQLDQMSLAGLIIALGLLVDNAIVVSESIMVRMAGRRKRSPCRTRGDQGAQGPALDRFTHHSRRVPADPARRIGRRRIHRRAFLGGDHHLAGLLGAGAHHDPGPLREVPETEEDRRAVQLEVLSLLPEKHSRGATTSRSQHCDRSRGVFRRDTALQFRSAALLSAAGQQLLRCGAHLPAGHFDSDHRGHDQGHGFVSRKRAQR